MAWTYVLRCSDGSDYVGSTTDLEQRLLAHNAGRGARDTQRRRPLSLAGSGDFESIAEAFAFEKRVQGWSRRNREALIAGDLDVLPLLARRSRSARAARGGA